MTTTSSTTTADGATGEGTSDEETTDGTGTSGGPTTSAEVESSTTTVNQAERSRALANLNLAKAQDEEVARSLNAINADANATLEAIAKAEARLEQAKAIESRTEQALADTDERQAEIRDALRLQAVEGFRSNRGEADLSLFSENNLGRAVRQEQMLSQANASTGDLLEVLRKLNEDRRLANAEASQAKVQAEEADRELKAEYSVLEDQRQAQLAIKSEVERRIDSWAGELNNYARSDRAVQAVIADAAQKAEVTPAAQPEPAQAGDEGGSTDQEEPPPASGSVGPTSGSGFQWPVIGRATSEFGYRIHPVYGTRRLHAGLDIGAANGTEIWSAADGVVIFSGVQGGYGQTVIVDHGGGITTLYAHQSSRVASNGATVQRGDLIGKVGSTGTSTGNHLHFEVRVEGQPKNPRDYLPAG